MSTIAGSKTPPGRPPEPAGSGISVTDVIYALFRHKWKIVIFSFLGVVAGGIVFYFKPPDYASQARLFVKYVRDTKAIDAGAAAQAEMKSPDSRGENIINTELEILSSGDLAMQVADLIGPDKILAKALPPRRGGTNRIDAAREILEGLVVGVPPKSSIIRVTYKHPDGDMAQKVLRQLVQSYLRKHNEVHRAVGLFDEFLTKQTDELRNRLTQTDADILKLKTELNVSSVEDARRSVAAEISQIRQDIMVTEAELAQRQSIVERLRGQARTTNNVAATNAEPVAVAAPIDPEKEKRYKSVCARLQSLQNRELDLLLQFTPESKSVQLVREQMTETEKAKTQLETEEPRLLAIAPRLNPTSPLSSASGSRAPTLDLATEQAQADALGARLHVLTNYLEKVRVEVLALNKAESGFNDLQRRRERQEADYRYFSGNLEQARMDEALGTGNIANINIVQDATASVVDYKPKLKLVAGAVGGGIATGIALALLLGLIMDQTIKRPDDVPAKLHLPMFLSIPDFSRNGYARPARVKATKAIAPKSGEAVPTGAAAETAMAPVDGSDPARLYHEALRDRLIMDFQIRDLHHKPKLVGVTGVGHQVGTSSIAAGLAQTLSETGDGNVLLVDMNPDRGPSVHPFYQGKAACGLADALEGERRPPAQFQENLYVVTAGDPAGNKVGIIPRKFAGLIPKLKASDYDYIIFDMPPVNQTSVTSKVAGLLDVTLLVVESERTPLDLAKRSAALLAEPRANVRVVLNRYHNYLPARLNTDV